MLALRPRLFSGRRLGRFVVQGHSTRCAYPLRSPVTLVRAFSARPPRQDKQDGNDEPKTLGKLTATIRENIYTLPNLLTTSRILACPVLGYMIMQDNFVAATSLLVYAGLTDLVCLSLASCYLRETVF
jgi:cardiolipin synthase (CMP-forming)